MERRVAVFDSFAEADRADVEYYAALRPEERLEILFQLRAMARKESDATSGRLARVYRITELPRR